MVFFMSVSMSDELQLFAQEIQSFLSLNTLRDLARDVGFVQRISKYQAKDSISFLLLGPFVIWILFVDADGFDFPASNDCWEHAEIMVEEERRIATISSLLIACFIFVRSFIRLELFVIFIKDNKN
jgi:hypothetical protein